MQAPVAFYFGLFLTSVGLAALVWDIFPKRGVIELSIPGGGSVRLDIPAVFVMILGVFLMVMSPKTAYEPKTPEPPPVLTKLSPSEGAAKGTEPVTTKTAPEEAVKRQVQDYHVRICTGDDPSWCGPVNLFLSCPNRPLDQLTQIACKHGANGLPSVAISGGGQCGKSVVEFVCKGQ